MTRPTIFLATLAFLLPGAASAQQVYVFPKEGQSEQQMNQDKGVCAAWAQQQSGFDPMNPPSEQQLMTQAQQPQSTGSPAGAGARVAGGAARGALVGSAIGKWTDNSRTNYGAAGAFIGSVRSARRQEAKATAQQQQAQHSAQQQAQTQLASMRDSYNRAFAACLEGKGYTVR
jgi:hypothetical protein